MRHRIHRPRQTHSQSIDTTPTGSYVMCKKMGGMGRLGNQMFQYALLLGVGKRLGLQPTLPKANRHSSEFRNLCVDQLFCIDAPDCSQSPVKTEIKEPPNDISVMSRVNELSVSDANINFTGYFQSEKYFKHAEQEVREAFTFRDTNLIPYVQKTLEAARRGFMPASGKVISIHVRRGDYLKLPLTFPFSERYYLNAMNHMVTVFGDRCHFVVISDDIPWCRDFFSRFPQYGTFSHTNGNLSVDLAMMTQTDHCIISNSSFGWWGAWLNNNPHKIITAPSVWFGPKGPKHDIYAQGWTILPS